MGSVKYISPSRDFLPTLSFESGLIHTKFHFMKLLISCVLSLAFSQCVAQQVFTCHTAITGKSTTKIEMVIFVTDSLVTFEVAEKPTSFKRLQTEDGIYYADGSATASITMNKKEGKKGGLFYNRILSFDSPSMYAKSCYCYKH
jgi:hypothetical protein